MGERRALTAQERMWLRHLLQQLSEQARTVRDAVDPLHGILALTPEQWAEQWAALTKPMDDYTRALASGGTAPAVSKVRDHNELRAA